MKKVGLLVFILALTIGFVFSNSCGFGRFGNLRGVRGSGTPKSETRNVSGFKAIEAGNAVNMEITAQKDFSVEIQADDNLLALIKTEVQGDTLKIYNDESISTKNEINIKISMPEITSIDISGASRVNVSAVKSDLLKLEASGASKIKIDGEANSLEIDASGASTVDAENLRVENANAQASGASKAIVSASNELKADASGASSVYYTGEPKNVAQQSSGASSVKRK